MATPTAAPNTYPVGQCTYYLKQVYPGLPDYMGNACNWLNYAKQRGWKTGSQPWNGAVVVYDCNLPGSKGYGHVAVVRSVNANGSFTVSEMNWRAWNQVDTRTETSRQYVLGFFQAPGGPGQTNPAPTTPARLAAASVGTGNGATARQTGTRQTVQKQDDPNAPCPPPGPATGARGMKCQVPLQMNGYRVNFSVPAPGVIGGPWPISFCIGGWSICFDGVVGVAAMGMGLGVIVLGVVLAVKNPVERVYGTYVETAGRGLEVVGGVAAQPEVVAVGSAASRSGRNIRQRGAASTARAEVARGYRRQRQQWYAARRAETAQANREAMRERMAQVRQGRSEATQATRQQARTERATERRLSRQRLSVEQQQRRRRFIDLGYSSVQATRMARVPDIGHGLDAAKEMTPGERRQGSNITGGPREARHLYRARRRYRESQP